LGIGIPLKEIQEGRCEFRERGGRIRLKLEGKLTTYRGITAPAILIIESIFI
jgi:hypothetical protein